MDRALKPRKHLWKIFILLGMRVANYVPLCFLAKQLCEFAKLHFFLLFGSLFEYFFCLTMKQIQFLRVRPKMTISNSNLALHEVFTLLAHVGLLIALQTIRLLVQRQFKTHTWSLLIWELPSSKGYQHSGKIMLTLY